MSRSSRVNSSKPLKRALPEILHCFYEGPKGTVGGKRAGDLMREKQSNFFDNDSVMRTIKCLQNSAASNENDLTLVLAKHLPESLPAQEKKKQWVSQDEASADLAHGDISYGDPVRQLKKKVKIQADPQ
jgi:hypothetical protein